LSEVVPGDQLPARAREITLEIAGETAPISIALTRQMLWRFGSQDRADGALSVDGRHAVELGGGPDVREGVQAPLEKRKPAFPGRVSANTPSGYPWRHDK